MRKFEKIRKHLNNNYVQLPHRKTTLAAGYDFYSPITINIPVNGVVHISTGIKCYMENDEFLQLSVRSGMATKGIIMAQGVGIVDADYVDSENNEGDIGFTLINLSGRPYTVYQGDRIGQGIFLKYGLTVDDEKDEKKKDD